jgi:2-keto-4-pentenoate hydratase
MTPSTETADWLMNEHAAGARFVPFAEARQIVTLADAYEVQREYVQRRAAAHRSAGAAYKIGLTSKAMQAMCRIDTPVAGVVLADQVHASGAVVDRARYGRFGIEFEIAVRLRHDLAPAPDGSVSMEAAAAAVGAVCPAIEIVDDRHCDYRALDVLSLVADNAWNAGIVLGEFRGAWPDLSAVEGAVYLDGAPAPLDRGTGSAVLGHPFAPVAWFARHLADRGELLRAGDVVMTGSMVTTKFPEAPGHWRFEVTGLGSVELQVL